MDGSADKPARDGIPSQPVNGCPRTHNPWVAGSIPAWPTSRTRRHELPIVGSTAAVGPTNGAPVYRHGAITAGTSTDHLVLWRPSDCFLFESDPMASVIPNPLAGTMQVRLELRPYVAAILNRYPNGIAVITSIPQPTNF